MGAIGMGTNSSAVDPVGCHMVHLASDRGCGPMEIHEMEVGGDYPLEAVQAETRNFKFCMERIEAYFGQDSHLSCTVGTVPEEHWREYCWGGSRAGPWSRYIP